VTRKLEPKVVAPNDVPSIQGYCGLVWELIDTKNTDAQKLNLALVTVDIGQAGQPHMHRATEELYFILQGRGQVNIAEMVHDVSQSYAVFIPPGYVHSIRNTGPDVLRLLAINSPPYDPNDTVFP
jgi:mannose-6-phosphate isomerase-like protein (cupin superfamily)